MRWHFNVSLNKSDTEKHIGIVEKTDYLKISTKWKFRYACNDAYNKEQWPEYKFVIIQN